jgi:hypothetical protein
MRHLDRISTVVCTTIETNRWYPEIMNNSPHPHDRASAMSLFPYHVYVTIEPVIDFDVDDMASLIMSCNPQQVNIGADSGENGLPEPPYEKIQELISLIDVHTKVVLKDNLSRLQGGKV